MKMLDKAQQFAEEFADDEFRHSKALIDGIRDGSISLYSAPDRSKQRAAEYLHIYRSRLDHLQTRTDTAHVNSLREDVRVLCENLSLDPNQKCELWIFNQIPYYDYSIFVGHLNRDIIGCVRGVDDRLIDQDMRRQLWGDSEEKKKENKIR